jgi:hypothetical protein
MLQANPHPSNERDLRLCMIMLQVGDMASHCCSCEDNDHERHRREGESRDSSAGRNAAGSTTIDLRGQTVGVWSHDGEIWTREQSGTASRAANERQWTSGTADDGRMQRRSTVDDIAFHSEVARWTIQVVEVTLLSSSVC